MVQCFAADCNHQSERETCRYFGFPSKKKKNKEFKRWKNLIGRVDKEPTESSRICSCHFRDGLKKNGPEIYERNKDKLFPPDESARPRKKRKTSKTAATNGKVCVQEEVERYLKEKADENVKPVGEQVSITQVLLEAELEQKCRELEKRSQTETYRRNRYSACTLPPNVIRMETGLPTRETFDIVVRHASRFKDSIVYYAGWKVVSISFEDQILITLMKVRQNYTCLHLAQLFHCSDSTISNIVTTFVHVLHSILFKDIMSTIPSREKNKISAPSSFSNFTSCKIIIDCTDIEVAAPGLMVQQKALYSSYRGMHSFKVIVGVAPNGVITYVSNLYPGSVSDKCIVKKSGLCDHLSPGDLVLADKGFLIQDIVPNDVAVNIPPFLNNGKFTESEAKLTKSIAKCRIHVERANARLKDFKILTFIPSYLRCYADTLFQLCAALVNLQFPLIKECCDAVEFE